MIQQEGSIASFRRISSRGYNFGYTVLDYTSVRFILFNTPRLKSRFTAIVLT